MFTKKFQIVSINSTKRTTLLILVTLVNISCAAVSCRVGVAGFKVPVYGFDLINQVLYYGKIEAPTDTIALDSPALSDEWVALKKADWQKVRTYCAGP